MKTKLIFPAFLLLASIILNSCTGSVAGNRQKPGPGQLKDGENGTIESMLIDAYSMLGDVSWKVGWESASSDYVIGDIRGMVANKGAGPEDLPEISQIQNFSEDPSNPYLENKWNEYYFGISKCNTGILKVKQERSANAISADQEDLYIRQLKALRGWYHFEAWRIWGDVPYMDENSHQDSGPDQGDIRTRIMFDLAAGTSLPNNMGNQGKFNGTVCQALLAKAKMQMFHDYRGALAYLDMAKNGTKPDGGAIGLAPVYGEIFDIEKSGGLEDIYCVQYSVNDGSGGYKEGPGDVSGYGFKSSDLPGDIFGYFAPTQEFVNSFRTYGGLPLLDGSYNDKPVKNDQGLRPGDPFTPDSGPLDPRIDWTVGRRGIPFWNWGDHKGSSWVWDQSYSGPWSPKKQVTRKAPGDQNAEVGKWTSGYRPSVFHLIRYADILLLIAECQIETGDLDGALRNINLVRARAANPAGFIMAGNHSAANYQISLYKSFPDADYARKALRMERKLELGMEGQRWFDLQRWGITAKEISRILSYEKGMPWGKSLYSSVSAINSNLFLPLPRQSTSLSSGKSNPGR